MDDSDYDEPNKIRTRPVRRVASQKARSQLRESSSGTSDSCGSKDSSDRSDSNDSSDSSDISSRDRWGTYIESESAASSMAYSESESRISTDDEEDGPLSRIVILKIPRLKDATHSASEGMTRKRSAQETGGEESVHRPTQASSQTFRPAAKRRKRDIANQAASPVLPNKSALLTSRTSLRRPSTQITQVMNESETEVLAVDLNTAWDSVPKALTKQSPELYPDKHPSKATTASAQKIAAQAMPTAKAQASLLRPSLLDFLPRGGEDKAFPKYASTSLAAYTVALTDLTTPPQSSTSPGKLVMSSSKEAVEQRRKADREAVHDRFRKEQARVDLERQKELSYLERRHKEEDELEEDKLSLARDIDAFLDRRPPWQADPVEEFMLTQKEKVDGRIAKMRGRKVFDGN